MRHTQTQREPNSVLFLFLQPPTQPAHPPPVRIRKLLHEEVHHDGLVPGEGHPGGHREGLQEVQVLAPLLPAARTKSLHRLTQGPLVPSVGGPLGQKPTSRVKVRRRFATPDNAVEVGNGASDMFRLTRQHLGRVRYGWSGKGRLREGPRWPVVAPERHKQTDDVLAHLGTQLSVAPLSGPGLQLLTLGGGSRTWARGTLPSRFLPDLRWVSAGCPKAMKKIVMLFSFDLSFQGATNFSPAPNPSNDN